MQKCTNLNALKILCCGEQFGAIPNQWSLVASAGNMFQVWFWRWSLLLLKQCGWCYTPPLYLRQLVPISCIVSRWASMIINLLAYNLCFSVPWASINNDSRLLIWIQFQLTKLCRQKVKNQCSCPQKLEQDLNFKNWYYKELLNVTVTMNSAHSYNVFEAWFTLMPRIAW